MGAGVFGQDVLVPEPEGMRADWDRLVTELDAWAASARALDDRRIEVWLPRERRGRRVVIELSVEEWSDMVSTMWGSFDSAVADVRQSLLALRPHERLVVYTQYRVEPAPAPDDESSAPAGDD
jgi:hypothetical protein